MASDERLRPVERCVLQMSARGLPDDEIGRRLGRGPDYVGQVRKLAGTPRPTATRPRPSSPLRPVERRVLRWLRDDPDRGTVAARFKRSPDFVDLVEDMANYKLRR